MNTTTTPLVLAEKADEVIALSLDESRSLKLRTQDISALTGVDESGDALDAVPFNVQGTPGEKVAYLFAVPGRIHTHAAQAIAAEQLRRATKRPRAARTVREMDSLLARACEARGMRSPITVESLAAGSHLR